MKFITVETLNNNSLKIFISESNASNGPKGVVHIYHGLAEHFGRYNETAKYFNSIGYHVVGIDHIGHGNWIESGALPGFFAENNGWDYVVDNMETSFKEVQKKYINLPHYILGHSMGTWLTLSLLQRDIYPTKVILSASSNAFLHSEHCFECDTQGSIWLFLDNLTKLATFEGPYESFGEFIIPDERQYFLHKFTPKSDVVIDVYALSPFSFFRSSISAS